MLQGVQNGQFEILITSYDTFRCSDHNQPWLFGLLLMCLTVSQSFSGQLHSVIMCPMRALYDDRWSMAINVSMCCWQSAIKPVEHINTHWYQWPDC